MDVTETRAAGGEAEHVRLREVALGAAIAIVFALLGMILLVGCAYWGLGSRLSGPVADGSWNARSRAWFTADGFFPGEIDAATFHRFSWTGARSHVVIPFLDRTQRYHLALRLSAARPAGVTPPVVRLFVDGVALAGASVGNEGRQVTVDMPARRSSGAVVTIVSDTWVPGPQDRRALGVIVDDISLTPASGHLRPMTSVVIRTGLAIAACAAGVLLCGLRRRVALPFMAAITFAQVWLLLYDGAFLGVYIGRFVNIGLGVACAGAIVAALRWRWPAVADLPEWSTAVGFVVGVTAVKLAMFAHPMATVGDAIFQVHRAALVHGGTYFFTSVTPRPFFEFPYPIALYVAALPFWRFFPSELDLARLLRGLSVGADALIAVALYAAVRRQWNDRRTALLCAVLWPFATAPLQALSNANLANAFGQSLFGVGMGVLGWNAAGKRPSVFASLLAAAFFCAAFLSHFSTLSVGIPIVVAGAACLFAGGRGPTRRFAAWALVIVLAASALSYVVYYSHFHAVYKATFARVMAGEGRAATRSIVAPPSVKFVRWATGAADDYGLPGVPALAFCAVGAVLIGMRRRHEPLTLILAGWLFVWSAFTALGILTPLAMRANLAVAPAFVCLAAYALGAINARWRRAGTVAAAAGAALIIWDGVRIALVCVGWLDPRWITYVN